MSAEDNNELDPRIKIELENLNSATDEINKLEIELEEANSTFRILYNESTRRLKLSTKKLGSCIEKARPYYEAVEKAREAQVECQKAAVKFQRANEIHAAAKETVALAEQRFMSNSHEWQFDNAWQEMLNHATQKVMDAEKQKAECHAEHQRRAKIFTTAEQKVQQYEDGYRRSIAKSRPYFEEKQICQDQLQTQKNRIQELQGQVQAAKSTYATALRNLERISDDIHRQRGDFVELGAREPGVGAELNSPITTTLPPLPDFQFNELEKFDYPTSSIASSQISLSACSRKSTQVDVNNVNDKNIVKDDDDDDDNDDLDECTIDYVENNELNSVVDEKDLEELRQKVKILAVRPIEGGDGQTTEQNTMWEHELNATVNKLDHLLLMKECASSKQQLQQVKQIENIENKRPDSLGAEAICQFHDNNNRNVNDVIIKNQYINSLPVTPQHQQLQQQQQQQQQLQQPLKKLLKLEPPSSVNVSMRELPLLARLSNEILDRTKASIIGQQRRRSLD